MTRPAPSTPPSPRPRRPARAPSGEPAAARVELREMRWWDIAPVLDLERGLFPDDAWSHGMFWSELAHARGPGATRHYVVAEAAGRILGYAGLAVQGDLADVQTIAVLREQWGTGLGARLLTDLLRHATAAGCAEVLLEVRVDNTRAQRLYRRFGFEPVGVRRGYYQPGNVDALVMRRVTGPTGPPEPPAAAHDPAAPQNPAAREGTSNTPYTPGSPNTPNTPDTAKIPDAPERQGPETHG